MTDQDAVRDRLFAERLPGVREALGHPVARDLSAALGWPPAIVSRIERGYRRATVGEAARICEHLGVDLTTMLDPATPLPAVIASARGRGR
jgi:transcriptional regulator with XRE-family HTH domain